MKGMDLLLWRGLKAPREILLLGVRIGTDPSPFLALLVRGRASQEMLRLSDIPPPRCRIWARFLRELPTDLVVSRRCPDKSS